MQDPPDFRTRTQTTRRFVDAPLPDPVAAKALSIASPRRSTCRRSRRGTPPTSAFRASVACTGPTYQARRHQHRRPRLLSPRWCSRQGLRLSQAQNPISFMTFSFEHEIPNCCDTGVIAGMAVSDDTGPWRCLRRCRDVFDSVAQLFAVLLRLRSATGQRVRGGVPYVFLLGHSRYRVEGDDHTDWPRPSARRRTSIEVTDFEAGLRTNGAAEASTSRGSNRDEQVRP